MKRLIVALYIALALQLGASPWLPPWLAHVVLIAMELVVVFLATRTWRRGAIGSGLVVLTVVGGGVLEFEAGIPGLAALGWGAGLLLASRRLSDPRAFPARGTLMTLAAASVLGRFVSTSAGYHFEETLATALSQGAALLTRTPIEFGPVYGGGRHLLIATIVLFAFSSTAASARTALRRLPLMALCAVALCALSSLMLTLMPQFGSGDLGMPRRILALAFPALGVGAWAAITAACTLWKTKRDTEADHGFDPGRGAWAVVPLAAAWLVSGIVMPTVGRVDSLSRYAIYEEGLLSWGRPSDDLYGKYSMGMLGTLPDFLEAHGATTSMVRDLTSAELEGCDALVVVNLDHKLPASEIAAVRAFVESGGSLFVVGDHTFLKDDGLEAKLLINDILDVPAVAFINDSADQLSPGWDHATLEFGPIHDQRCEHGNPSGVLVGGSLELGLSGNPLLIGRYGYSDIGIDEVGEGNRGFLGNLLWDRGERLGGVVLAAWSQVGEGRILVAGDTTGLTNSGRLSRWEWWSRFFSLDALPTERDQATQLAGAAIALLLGLFFLLYPALLGLAVLGVLLSSTLVGVVGQRHRAPIFDGGTGNLALIDLSLHPRGRIGSWLTEGAAAVPTNLHRVGLLPMFHESPSAEELEGVDYVFLLPAQSVPSSEHVERLLSWTRDGGNLFISVGHVHAPQVEELLTRLDAWVSAVVLPAQRGTWVNRVEPVVASPFMPEAWWFGGSADWKPRVLVDNKMVIGERDFGRGRVVLVSDPMFFANHSLEGTWGHNLGNVTTFQDLVTTRVSGWDQ